LAVVGSFQGALHALKHASEPFHEVGQVIHNSGISTRDYA
jgi:hypothetical protein